MKRFLNTLATTASELLSSDDGSNDTTIRAMVEIIREHGEGLVEILATVSAAKADKEFEAWCQRARTHNMVGRFSMRKVAA